MREYAKISPRFWIGQTGKAIRRLGPETQVLALYLLSSPHANMIGLYHLPLPYIVADTGIPFEGACKALRSLEEIGFCTFDRDAEVIWVIEMACYQIGEALKPTDLQAKGVDREYKSVPPCQQLQGFWLKYKDSYHLKEGRAFEAPSKPLRSQEQEQEQEIEKEQEVNRSAEQIEKMALGELLDPVAPKKTAKAQTKTETELQAACREMWKAYAAAYASRYGAAPVSNVQVRSQAKAFVSRVGMEEAPQIAAWFVRHPGQFYVSKGHTIGALLTDAEKLRTEWATGRVVTAAQSRQSDRAGATANAVHQILAERGETA